MSAKAAVQYSPMLAKVVDGHGGDGGPAPATSAQAGTPEEAERRRQILAILEQGDRDIAAGNGRDWDDVKQRMRDRIAARLR
jgi:hypothetical protein